MTWLTLIASSLYFFLPAYVANMCPTIAGSLHLPLGEPLSTPLFGNHKTLRGLLAGVAGAFVTVMMQQILQSYGIADAWRMTDYNAESLWQLTLLLGGGAVLGDLLKSFFKRRLGKPPGAPWVPFDQLDFVAGALLFVLPFYPMDIAHIAVIVIATPLLHFAVNVIGYFLGMKKVWW